MARAVPAPMHRDHDFIHRTLPETPPDAELIASLVAFTTRGRSWARTAWARPFVDGFGGILGLARADPTEIAMRLAQERVPRAAARASAIATAFELGRRVAAAQAIEPERIAGSEDVALWARRKLSGLLHEELWILALDGRSRLRAERRVAQGGLSTMTVEAADVLRTALRMGAAGFVLVHNHPSGDPAPSAEDTAFTEAVASAAAAIGLPLLDHVVVAEDRFATVPLAAPEWQRPMKPQ